MDSLRYRVTERMLVIVMVLAQFVSLSMLAGKCEKISILSELKSNLHNHKGTTPEI